MNKMTPTEILRKERGYDMKKIRQQFGLNQVQMSAMLEINNSVYSRMEKGQVGNRDALMRMRELKLEANGKI
jgi:predicted transcriptional regulator